MSAPRDVSEFKAQAVSLMTTAANQVKTLRSKSSTVARMIIESDDPSSDMAAFFVAARGEYATAKRSGQKVRCTELGKGWNALRSAIAYHVGESGMVASWPNFATGVGECRLLTKEEEKGRKEIEKEAAQAADDAAVAESMSRAQEEQLTALRTLGPDDVANQIADMISAWGGDPMVVLAILTDRLTTVTLPSVPEMNAAA